MRGLGVLAAVAACAACDGSVAAGPKPGGADGRWLRAAWSAPAPLQPSQRAPGACPVQQKPAIALRGDGVLVAVWHDAAKGDLASLVWAERAPGASAWGQPRPVVADARGYWQDGPVRLARAPDGALALVWLSARDPRSPRETRMAVLGRSGGGWSPAPPPVGVAARDLVLAPGPDGLHAAWTGDTVLHTVRGADGGWRAPERLRPPGRTVEVRVTGGPSPQRIATSAQGAMVAAAPDGRVLVAWWDDERTLDSSGAGEWDLMARIYDPAERRWSGPERVSGARSKNPDAAAAAAADGFVLLFTDDDRRLQALHRPFAGGRWTQAAVADRQGARAFEPALAAGPKGELLLTWRSFTAGGGRPALGAAMHEGGGRFAALPAPPATDADLFDHGGVLNAAGAPVLWFDDGEVQQGCAGVAVSEMKP